jgi:hypothetical protein
MGTKAGTTAGISILPGRPAEKDVIRSLSESLCDREDSGEVLSGQQVGELFIEAVMPGARAQMRELHEVLALAARYGVDDKLLNRLLYPNGSYLGKMIKLIELAPIAEDVAALREVIARGNLSPAAADLLSRAVAIDAPRASEHDALEAELGFGERRGVLPPAVGEWTIADLRQAALRRPGYVTERALAVYDTLLPLVPPQRRRSKATRYNEAALRLTARIVSAFYWFDGVRPLSKEDVRARLQKRAARSKDTSVQTQ